MNIPQNVRPKGNYIITESLPRRQSQKNSHVYYTRSGRVLEFAPNPRWVSNFISMGIKEIKYHLLYKTMVLIFFLNGDKLNG
jgi:hypothetical protein